MGFTNSRHRPLRAGLRVIPGEVRHTEYGAIESISQVQPLTPDWEGTLTGLATRDLDQKKALVTNFHVLVGLSGTNRAYRNKTGREELFQGSLTEGDRVADTIAGEIDLTGTNDIDAGYCLLRTGGHGRCHRGGAALAVQCGGKPGPSSTAQEHVTHRQLEQPGR